MRTPKVRSLVRSFLAATLLAACSEGAQPRVSELEPTRPEPTKVTKLVTPDAGTPVVVAPEPEKPEKKKELVIPATYKERMRDAKRMVKAGKLDDAVTLFRAAAEAEPEKAEPQVELARTHLTRKDWKAARKAAEKAVELAPDSSSAWNTLGRVEWADRDDEAAIAACEKAIEKNPDNSWAWNNLGLVYLETKRPEQAVTALEQAVSGDEPEPYMWSNLGLAYERLDRLVEARAAYKQAARQGSDLAKKAIARIDEKEKQQAKVGPPDGGE
jgi:tetratricopeptide (TPR) repeat protein